jgi:hypothetical protein
MSEPRRWPTAVIPLLALIATPVATAVETPDPRDAELAGYVHEITRNVLAAARGEATDPRWNEVGGAGDGLNTTSDETRLTVAELGAPLETLVTVLELEAIGTGGAGPLYLRSSCAVFPDGRVRWLEASVRAGEVFVGGDDDLAKVAPALAAAVDRVIEALGSPGCRLPTAHSDDLAGFPEPLRKEFEGGADSVRETCGELAQHETSWTPRVDDVSVLVRAGETVALLRSSLELNNGHLSLCRVRFRDVPN